MVMEVKHLVSPERNRSNAKTGIWPLCERTSRRPVNLAFVHLQRGLAQMQVVTARTIMKLLSDVGKLSSWHAGTGERASGPTPLYRHLSQIDTRPYLGYTPLNQNLYMRLNSFIDPMTTLWNLSGKAIFFCLSRLLVLKSFLNHIFLDSLLLLRYLAYPVQHFNT